MGKTLVAHQPNYLPYLGFFHKAARADIVVLQDDLKYIKNDYGNRNRVQAEDEWRWLSVPVRANNSSTFADVIPAEPKWTRDHANILRSKYRTARHRDRLDPYLAIMEQHSSASLATLNIALIRELFVCLGLDIPVVIESELDAGEFADPNDRLISLCDRFDCDTYLSGSGAQAYIDDAVWARFPVEFAWSDYRPVEYDRGGAPWIPNLSVIDAIVHTDDPASLIA